MNNSSGDEKPRGRCIFKRRTWSRETEGPETGSLDRFPRVPNPPAYRSIKSPKHTPPSVEGGTVPFVVVVSLDCSDKTLLPARSILFPHGRRSSHTQHLIGLNPNPMNDTRRRVGERIGSAMRKITDGQGHRALGRDF